MHTLRASLGAKNRRGFEGLKSSSYSNLNKKRILIPPIHSDFLAPKLVLYVFFVFLPSIIGFRIVIAISRQFRERHVMQGLGLCPCRSSLLLPVRTRSGTNQACFVKNGQKNVAEKSPIRAIAVPVDLEPWTPWNPARERYARGAWRMKP